MPWSAVAGAVVSWGLNELTAPDTSSASSAADPFAGQRPQYQAQLQQLMTGQFTPTDPSYAWRFSQGEQALERSTGAQGLLNSGNRLTALSDYGQGQASTEYANQFSRLSQLAGANVGSPAAAGQIIANQNTATANANAAVGNVIGRAVTGWANSPAGSGSSSGSGSGSTFGVDTVPTYSDGGGLA